MSHPLPDQQLACANLPILYLTSVFAFFVFVLCFVLPFFSSLWLDLSDLPHIQTKHDLNLLNRLDLVELGSQVTTARADGGSSCRKGGATATKTRGEAPNRRGRRTRPRTAPRRGRRGSLDFFFFFYTRSAREEGNVDNAVRDGGGGISMVHRCGLKNLLMVKVRALEILKLRTTRNNPTKDRPTARVTIENFWARRGRELSQILT